MPAVTTTSTKIRSNKKIFQCTGFGDCNMVFTRSEHLARHTRKHTGEKPYLCIVPGCTRRFSRFDNMMQHTQTHKTKPLKEAAAAAAAAAPPSPPTTPTSTTSPPLLKELYLTQDEFEALQGLGQFRHTPIFIDSLKDLASAVYITPNPRLHSTFH